MMVKAQWKVKALWRVWWIVMNCIISNGSLCWRQFCQSFSSGFGCDGEEIVTLPYLRRYIRYSSFNRTFSWWFIVGNFARQSRITYGGTKLGYCTISIHSSSALSRCSPPPWITPHSYYFQGGLLPMFIARFLIHLVVVHVSTYTGQVIDRRD
jgi:hypothetical protein